MSAFSDSLEGAALRKYQGPRSFGVPRKRPPFPKGLAGWILRRIAKNKEARAAVFDRVSGDLQHAAEQLFYANELPAPVKPRKGKRVEATAPHVVVPVTPGRVLARMLGSLGEKRSDVFDDKEPVGTYDAFESLFNDRLGYVSVQLYRQRLILKDGIITLTGRALGELITDEEVEVPAELYSGDIARRLEEWGAVHPRVSWKFERIDDGSGWNYWPTYVVYDMDAEFKFDVAAAVLAMFGRESLLRESAKVIREAQE